MLLVELGGAAPSSVLSTDLLEKWWNQCSLWSNFEGWVFAEAVLLMIIGFSFGFYLKVLKSGPTLVLCGSDPWKAVSLSVSWVLCSLWGNASTWVAWVLFASSMVWEPARDGFDRNGHACVHGPLDFLETCSCHIPLFLHRLWKERTQASPRWDCPSPSLPSQPAALMTPDKALK